MRIAVLSRNFSSTGGGAERYAIALVEQLAPRHEVHVFSQTIAHQFPGVTYHTVPLPMKRPRWINQLWFAYATWKATRSGFDIVHSHENTWHGNVQTVHVLPVKHTLFDGKTGVAKLLRWAKVVTSPRLLAYLWLEKARYAIAPRRTVIVTSDWLRQVMERCFPQVRTSLKVVAPGVTGVFASADLDEKRTARAALQLPKAGQGLLFVGNDFRKKGLPTLFQALLGLPDIWLAVVGQGEQDAAMRQMASELHLTERVHFLGALEQMDTAYRAVDCLVHPTLEDTYAMVVLEAMSHGLPVVVSGPRYCGIAAELTAGLNAVVLQDPQSTQEVRQAIAGILRDPLAASALGNHARAFAAQHTWQQVGQQHEQIYQRVAPRFQQRWLVLSHAFNMDGRAASQTITDKLPHLEAAGIELVVLSGVSGRQDAWYEHYQLWPAGPAGIRFELRHVMRKHLGPGMGYRAVMLLASLVLLPFMLVEKLLRPVESSWSWWLSAYIKGLLLLRARKFDLIYSTGGAFAAHVGAAALKRTTGVRWLAEVHDPMVTPGSVPTTPQQKMQARVETTICREADVAIWFTEAALASAKRRNPELGERGHMMLPGVDAPAFQLEPYKPTSKFVIGHFGSLSETRNLSLVISAMDQLMDEIPALVGVMELHVYGGPLDHISDAARQNAKYGFLRHFGRIETDPVTGKSGREQILQKMRSADVLLLLHGIEPICAEYIPSKMYEYLWMQRPILALVYCNVQLGAILSGSGHTTIDMQDESVKSAASNIAKIREKMEAYAGMWMTSGIPDSPLGSRYSTGNTVRQLLNWI
ncbi:glycosyltransferase [Rhodoferax sp. GW822-FHT02A01]|uniref:glycosyltransferase family 4 protein n=1 Tax=Rhodoferax sp. GW822-FHT02A01 TaxID=3141537 RepID=UPI00315D1725